MQFVIILMLVLLNGLLAMSEIAVVSARRARLKDLAEEGSKRAEKALKLSEDPNRFLSTVQVGITLVGILAGALGGVTLGEEVGSWLATLIPVLAPYSRSIGVGAVVLMTTYLSLVLGELAPKRIGMEYPEQISSLIAGPMTNLSRLGAPVVWLLSFSTSLVLRLVGINPSDEPSITESEIIHMIREGTNEGVFDTEEVQMIQGVFRLDDKLVGEIMTPRLDVQLLTLNDSLERIKDVVLNTPHNHYPVCDGNIDRIVGVVTAKDLLRSLMQNNEVDLNKLLKPLMFMPEVAVVSRALERFKASGTHVAMVIGEHGGIEGLVTINDVLEEIVGDIDADDQDIVQREDGSWLLDGRMPLTRFSEFLPEQLMLPEREIGSYQTLAGFIMARLGRLPEISDVFRYEGLRFEVVDMDGVRIDRVLVSEVEPEVKDRDPGEKPAKNREDTAPKSKTRDEKPADA